MLSIRDPVHGFVRADPLETALVNSRPVQRLRFIHQLGFTFLVFPGAEHSRFGHVIGAMHLAGRVYDALCSKSGGMLPGESRAPERRLARAAARTSRRSRLRPPGGSRPSLLAHRAS